MAKMVLMNEQYLLHALLENSPDYIFFKDRQSRFIVTNDAHARLLLGLNNAQEAIGKTDFDLFKREEAQRFYDEEQRIMETGQPVIAREWLLHSSTTGQEVWLSEHKLPMRDETGQVIGLLGIARDTTERKRMEEALRQAHAELERRVEERTAELAQVNANLKAEINERKQIEDALRESESLYHSLVEVLPQSLCRKDLAGRFTFGNQRFCEGLKISLAEIVGKTDFDIHPPELAEKYRQDDKRVVETGATVETVEEHQPLGSDKTYVQVVKSPIWDAEGKITGVQAIFWDVTERKRADEALRESEKRYRQIVDAANEGIWVIDEDRRTTFANARMAQMLGYQVEEMIGRRLDVFVFDEDLPDQARKMEARRQGLVEQYERRWRRKDGQLVWTIVSATPVFDAGHHFRGSFGMLTDITKRKGAEETLRKRNEELERFEQAVIGRELKMIELKKRITELEEKYHDKKGDRHES